MATITGEVRLTDRSTNYLPEWGGEVLVTLDPGEHPPTVIQEWPLEPGNVDQVQRITVHIDWRADAPQAVTVTLCWPFHLTLDLPPTLVRFRVARPEAA